MRPYVIILGSVYECKTSDYLPLAQAQASETFRLLSCTAKTMSSKLPTTARHLLRQPSRRLTPQRYLLTSPPNDAFRSPQLSRHPPSLVDLTSQLTPEHEAYYGSILLHAVLNSNDHTASATHNHVLNSSHVDPAPPEPEPSPPPEKVSDEEWEIRTGTFTRHEGAILERGLIRLSGSSN